MDSLFRSLELCLERLPESAAEAATLVSRILEGLEKHSYSEQMAHVMLTYLRGQRPDCKQELRQWLAGLRNPGLHRGYALPGAPPPPSGP